MSHVELSFNKSLVNLLIAIQTLGEAICFAGSLFLAFVRMKQLLGLLKEQIISIGLWPFVVNLLSAICMGSVLFLQAHRSLSPFGLEGQLPLFIAIPLLREFGPVLAAWLLTGVVGSAMTAETGLMKATEQLLSLELMGIDPTGRIFLPRFLAILLLAPIITLSFVAIALSSSLVVGAIFFNFNAHYFWDLCLQNIYWKEELTTLLFKTFLFAVLIAWITLFSGFNAKPDSEGVSQATTRSVTLGLLAVLFSDLIYTVCAK